MIAFIEKLNSEVLRSIERIESRDTDVLKKSLEASRVLGEACDRGKHYIRPASRHAAAAVQELPA